MRLGGQCEACKAKDEELVHLRKQNSELVGKVMSMVDPTLEARLARAKRLEEAPPVQPGEPPVRASAAFFRRTRRDGPPVRPMPSAAEVEDAFRVKGPA